MCIRDSSPIFKTYRENSNDANASMDISTLHGSFKVTEPPLINILNDPRVAKPTQNHTSPYAFPRPNPEPFTHSEEVQGDCASQAFRSPHLNVQRGASDYSNVHMQRSAISEQKRIVERNENYYYLIKRQEAINNQLKMEKKLREEQIKSCLLYTSDAADE
eukprot:TRINITY_DN20165_c0_g1_i1.p1 TRINITY_DN20165_c0_g1~~TRINITY_DN20165_c0_g1_i1.p1  ORF type:complete len:161 (-),score=19.39 TRINITY_DN20165_c0_g1_i1:47-529(-)